MLGLPLGWLGALAVSRADGARIGLALPVAIGRPELALVVALIVVGVVLAAVPAWRC